MVHPEDETAVDKLLEAQRLYREYSGNPKDQMRVHYDPSGGYRMVINGTIFCHEIRTFEAFAERVLEIARQLREHADENARVGEVNRLLEGTGGESPEGERER